MEFLAGARPEEGAAQQITHQGDIVHQQLGVRTSTAGYRCCRLPSVLGVVSDQRWKRSSVVEYHQSKPEAGVWSDNWKDRRKPACQRDWLLFKHLVSFLRKRC